MSETPFYFLRGNALLFAMAHIPDEMASTVGAVLSHPFAEEKLWSHRVYVSLARVLARAGHPVLRFDYTGAGDSSGTTRETSLETHIEDLAGAVMELVRLSPGVKRVALVGLRLGATIAALLAERAADSAEQTYVHDAPLVLWDPITDGEAYFQELLRSNLSTQLAVYGSVRENREQLQQRIANGEAVNVDGYEIGSALFDSCARADLLPVSGVKRHRGPALVVQIAQNFKRKDRQDLVDLAGSFANGEFARVNEQPFWREIRQFYGRAASLETLTGDWLERADDER